MPTRKSKRSRRSRASLEWDRLDVFDRHSLWQGRTGNLIGPNSGVLTTEEILHEAYQINRDELLAIWEGHREGFRYHLGGYLPGTRPGSWWKLEAPDQPATLGTIQKAIGSSETGFREFDVYETEEECLRRLGLIGDHERSLVDGWNEQLRNTFRKHRPDKRYCPCRDCYAAIQIKSHERDLAELSGL